MKFKTSNGTPQSECSFTFCSNKGVQVIAFRIGDFLKRMEFGPICERHRELSQSPEKARGQMSAQGIVFNLKRIKK